MMRERELLPFLLAFVLALGRHGAASCYRLSCKQASRADGTSVTASSEIEVPVFGILDDLRPVDAGNDDGAHNGREGQGDSEARPKAI